MSKLLYTRFTKLIIDYLLSINKSIPRRSDSKLHSSQDDHPITKLLNITNGDYKFGMEVPDAMISDAIKKKSGYKYYMAKKVESKKAKIVDEPEEQHISLIKSGKGNGFMCYGDQVANVPNKLKKDDVLRKTKSLTIAEEAVVGELANSISIQEPLSQRRRRSQLTIDSQTDKAVPDMYNEWGHKLEGTTVEDPAIQSLLDLQKGSKASRLENLRQKKQPVVGEGSNKSANELTDFMSHLVYTDAQTTLMVHNPEVNPELISYILGASEVPLGTHEDVLVTKSLMQEMFPDENVHQEKYTTCITKHYAARYYKEGIEDRIPKRWSKEVRCYHFDALNGIHHWEKNRIDFFKAGMSAKTKGNVFSYLRIKSVVRIDVKKKWGHGFLTSIVRRSDDKEYEFSYADLHRISVNDVEDMYLLQVQDKLHHLPLEFGKDFNNALLMFIRRTMIKNRVEDIQLGVESYQRTLNLTKPIMFFEGIDQRIPFTMTAMHKRVVYLNQYNIKSLMKLSEVKRFSNGTLVKIQENLIDMLSKKKLGIGNKRLKGRDWTDYDVKSSRAMLKKIDEVLRYRENLRRLEEYVGGCPKTINPRTFIKGKEHGKQLYKAVINGPFKYGTIVVPGTPPTPASVRDRTYEELTEPEKICKAYDIRGTNIVLQGLPQDIYNLERESKLYDEFDTFTSEKGETIHSYYLRFAQLINDMHTIGMSMQPLQVNTKFVIHLQQEWSKFVTDVKLAKDLHNTNFDHLYSYLRQHEAHANEVRLMRQ
ncbi:hypothetical protein Tco_1303680 [Tanacetum coccineum]